MAILSVCTRVMYIFSFLLRLRPRTAVEEEQYVEDCRLAILLQNEEFIRELKRNDEFLKELEKGLSGHFFVCQCFSYTIFSSQTKISVWKIPSRFY